jgi:hypothetical protein
VADLGAERIAKHAQWVAETILLFGGQASTAFLCAATFAAGLEDEPNPHALIRRHVIQKKERHSA